MGFGEPMTRVDLSFHGIGVQLVAADASAGQLLGRLREDFAYFETRPGQPAPIRLELSCAESSAAIPIPTGPRVFSTRMCEVYGAGGRIGGPRVCIYDQSTAVALTSSAATRLFTIVGADPELVYEVAYVAILSSVGEALDLKGFHRVHALGVEYDGNAGIVILPPGGGKSAMAALLLQHTRSIRIFSDEIPLVRDGRLHPFPLRIALAPAVARALRIEKPSRLFKRRIFPEKLLYGIDPDRVANSMPISFAIAGRLGNGDQPRISPANGMRIFGALASQLVVGLGVPQMAEFMLRSDFVPRLPGVALSRLWASVQLCAQADLHSFELVQDARKNARALARFLGCGEWMD